jgi:hypothetical protein
MATFTTAGAIPSSPQQLLNNEIAQATALSPGLTANLPGSLIEDMASTATGAVIIQDQAFVDLVNSISPYTANPFILYQLGAVYGVLQGQGSNTSVYVTFTGTTGFVIPIGFTVSDGTYQYTVQDGGIIGTGGISSALYCLATVSGSWAVNEGTVTKIITSLPSGVTLTCTNLTTGVPGTSAQTIESYQAQVIQAGLSTAQGVSAFLKTQLQNVSGVQANLISVRLVGTNQWEILVGGGDPYQVANAIFNSIPDISMLVGSKFTITSITTSTNAVITLNYSPGYTIGQTITVNGATPSAYNTTYVITGISTAYSGTGVTTTITTSTNTSTFGSFVSTTAYLTPNPRNEVVSINDYPDSYSINFVLPPAQTVILSLSWNTSAPNYVNPSAVTELAQPALVSYINNIPVGQPINTFEIQNIFQSSISSIIPIQFISEIIVAVYINGVSASPPVGSGLIAGDPESYFNTNVGLVTITQI